MNLQEEKLSYLVYKNYMPYGAEVITERAIPRIDGLKPVQRRDIFGLHKLNAYDHNIKSARAVGDVMGKYHPHGDSSIYDSMCIMTDTYNGLNVPYIKGQGYFGTVLSDASAAAMRYTEIRLMPICKELLEGINENAVDFVDNFDGTEKEPLLLPVKYPSVLVSTTDGIAVGMGSAIPNFSLKNACLATIGVINGDIKNAYQLSKVLGVPEYTTGGVLHASDRDLERLCDTGCGKFYLTGTAITYPNEIIILELPYGVTVDKFINSVIEATKEGKIDGIRDVLNVSDKKGFKISVQLRRGTDPDVVLRKLYRYTDLRTPVSFRTKIIIDGEPRDLSLLELVHEWVKFRQATLSRIYKFRLDALEDKIKLLEVWLKIKGRTTEAAKIATSMKHDEARAELMKVFDITPEQADYLLSFRLSQLTVDRAEKGLQDYYNAVKDADDIKKILGSTDELNKIIVEQLSEIISKYGKENNTHRGDELDDYELGRKPEVVEINSDTVHIVLTEKGYIKRLTQLREMQTFAPPAGDKEIGRWILKNNEQLLVFTYSGEVHKVLANDVDAGRGLNEKLCDKLGITQNDIMFIDIAGDYSGHFNLVYGNGKCYKVFYNKFAGSRKKYVSLYEACSNRHAVVTKADKFIVVTVRRKANLANLEYLRNNQKAAVAGRICRIPSNDMIVGAVPIDKVPMDKDEVQKYFKDYAVLVRDDKLWNSLDDLQNLSLWNNLELAKKYLADKESASNSSTDNVQE